MSGKIHQPKDANIEKRFDKAVKLRGRLTWHPNFGFVWSGKFHKAQVFVDNEVIKLSVPFVPKRDGILIRSALIATNIGSGEVIYRTPYARYQYYGKLMVDPDTGSAWARPGVTKVLTNRDLNHAESPRGRFWFEMMKEKHKLDILRGAKQIVKK